MENRASLSVLNWSLLRFWLSVVAVACAAALGLVGIEALSQTPGVRRTFTVIILPYAIIAAGLVCPLLYALANFLRSRNIPLVLIGICLITGVMLGSALVGWIYFQWVIPIPRAPFPIWKFLSKELIGISLPFWIVLLSIWLWHTRAQLLVSRNRPKPIEPDTLPTTSEKITATYGPDRYQLDPSEVEFIKAEGNFCKIYSKDKFYLKNATLKSLEKQPYGLLRIHRSAMINPGFIASTRSLGHGDLMVTLKSGEELKCSRGYAKALKMALGI